MLVNTAERINWRYSTWGQPGTGLNSQQSSATNSGRWARQDKQISRARHIRPARQPAASRVAGTGGRAKPISVGPPAPVPGRPASHVLSFTCAGRASAHRPPRDPYRANRIRGSDANRGARAAAASPIGFLAASANVAPVPSRPATATNQAWPAAHVRPGRPAPQPFYVWRACLYKQLARQIVARKWRVAADGRPRFEWRRRPAGSRFWRARALAKRSNPIRAPIFNLARRHVSPRGSRFFGARPKQINLAPVGPPAAGPPYSATSGERRAPPPN